MQWGASFIYGYAAKTGVSQAYIMDLIQKRLTTSEAIDDVKKTKENKNLNLKRKFLLGDQNFNF